MDQFRAEFQVRGANRAELVDRAQRILATLDPEATWTIEITAQAAAPHAIAPDRVPCWVGGVTANA